MATAAGVTVPNNVTGATIGALVGTIVIWLLDLWPTFAKSPDEVKQALASLIVVGVTALGGWIEHRKRSTTS
jgi:ribose/xylose/arabinose/galactoside ABC-type transport system permease subunit